MQQRAIKVDNYGLDGKREGYFHAFANSARNAPMMVS
jgi:hypothetical protein